MFSLFQGVWAFFQRQRKRTYNLRSRKRITSEEAEADRFNTGLILVKGEFKWGFVKAAEGGVVRLQEGLHRGFEYMSTQLNNYYFFLCWKRGESFYMKKHSLTFESEFNSMRSLYKTTQKWPCYFRGRFHNLPTLRD